MSISVCRMTSASLQFVNRPPISASAAEDTTMRRMPVGLRIAPFVMDPR